MAVIYIRPLLASLSDGFFFGWSGGQGEEQLLRLNALSLSLFPFIRITILNFTIYSLAGRFDLAGSGECLLLLAKACPKLL